MADEEEPSIEEILASIRNILWEKEVEKNASRFRVSSAQPQDTGDVFELRHDMIVDNADLPYEYADWDFKDVATRILRKYADFFKHNEKKDSQSRRVRAKADS